MMGKWQGVFTIHTLTHTNVYAHTNVHAQDLSVCTDMCVRVISLKDTLYPYK